ncbi:GPO family capsid scaffolding protein, partial [Candidatus Dependentiae bacterium]|nr:GPO family capsid scaffolding protein [Candidatus Dependentiae bacterium]
MMMKNKISGLLLLSLMVSGSAVLGTSLREKTKNWLPFGSKPKTNASGAAAGVQKPVAGQALSQNLTATSSSGNAPGSTPALETQAGQKKRIFDNTRTNVSNAFNSFTSAIGIGKSKQTPSLGSAAPAASASEQLSATQNIPASSPSAGAKTRFGGFFTKKAVDLDARSAAVHSSVDALSGRLKAQEADQSRLKTASERAKEANQALAQAEAAFNAVK